jgi:HK97 family phage portal protein
VGFLGRLLATDQGPPNPALGPWDDFWYNNVGGMMTSSGHRMTPEQALTISTFYRGVAIIAEGVAKLPVRIFRRTPQGKEPADNHPIADLLRFQVNERDLAFTWFEYMTGSACLRGHGYTRILPGRRGFADRFQPLDASRVTAEKLDTGRILYHYKLEDGTNATYNQDEIIDYIGPFGGMSAVSAMKESLGIAKGTEAFAGEQLGRAPMMAGFLYSDDPAVKVDPNKRKEIGDTFREANAGPGKRNGVAVLTGGLKWANVGMNLADAQFLETRRFQREEIATFLGIPPHKLGILEHAHFNNIEHQAQEFITDCLLSWVRRWEQTISRDLILDPSYFAEFNFDGLLRGATLERFQAYQIATGNRPWMKPDEVRERESMNRLGGDLDTVQEGLGTTKTTPPPPSPTTPTKTPGNAVEGNGKGHRVVNRLGEAGA